MRICAFADEASNDLSGQIDALARNSIKLLEIRGVDGENIKDISHKKILEIKNKLEENGLKVWSLGSPMGKNDPENDFAKQLYDFEHLMESAEILGCSHIRLFSFFTKNEALALDRLEKFLKAAPKNMVLCHENEKGIFGDVPSRCVIIHENIPKIKAVFDPANFVQCGVDTLEAYGMLKNYIKYMHIKDSRLDGSIVPAGYGDGNFGPDDTVTYNQAVKMVVSALGFDPMANSKGGWPTGYLVVANTYNIINRQRSAVKTGARFLTGGTGHV